MQCPNCSAEITSGNFCTNCGSPLPTLKQDPIEPEAAVAEPVEPEAALEPDAIEMPSEGAYVPPTYDSAPNPAEPAAMPAYGTSSQGVLNQAWDDLIHDPSMVKKVALMGLIDLIPILRFVNIGYGLRWGRRAAFRTGDQLPKKLFGDRAFETGFYAFVIVVAWAVVLGAISAVPLAGAVVAILAVPFLMLALGYMTLVEEIGAGFRLSQLWEKGKRSYGGLLAIAYVPGLVVCLIASVILSVLAMLFGLSAIGLYGALLLNSGATAGVALTSTVTVFFALLVFVYAISVISTMAKLISYRALGYWMGRMAPEWIQESISKGADPR